MAVKCIESVTEQSAPRLAGVAVTSMGRRNADAERHGSVIIRADAYAQVADQDVAFAQSHGALKPASCERRCGRLGVDEGACLGDARRAPALKTRHGGISTTGK